MLESFCTGEWVNVCSKFDGNWVDVCSVIGGLIYAAWMKRKKCMPKWIAKPLGAEFLTGLGIFPLLLLGLGVFSKFLLTQVVEASRITLPIAAFMALIAMLEDDVIQPVPKGDQTPVVSPSQRNVGNKGKAQPQGPRRNNQNNRRGRR